MSVPDQIRRLRRVAGLTQAEAARRCHVHRSTWSAWETGKRLPQSSLLQDIARRLHGEIVLR